MVRDASRRRWPRATAPAFRRRLTPEHLGRTGTQRAHAHTTTIDSSHAFPEPHPIAPNHRLYHKQIPCLIRLANAFPDTGICLNHCGSPIIPNAGGSCVTRKQVQSRDEVFAEWKVSIAELAKCPNVVVKVGGLPMPISGTDWCCRPVPPTAAEVAQRMGPWYLYVIEQFGADRCIFESNFPMDRVSSSAAALRHRSTFATAPAVRDTSS